MAYIELFTRSTFFFFWNLSEISETFAIRRQCTRENRGVHFVSETFAKRLKHFRIRRESDVFFISIFARITTYIFFVSNQFRNGVSITEYKRFSPPKNVSESTRVRNHLWNSTNSRRPKRSERRGRLYYLLRRTGRQHCVHNAVVVVSSSRRRLQYRQVLSL